MWGTYQCFTNIHENISKEKDDVNARELFKTWQPEIPAVLRDAKNRSNKEICHLTNKRKTQEKKLGYPKSCEGARRPAI